LRSHPSWFLLIAVKKPISPLLLRSGLHPHTQLQQPTRVKKNFGVDWGGAGLTTERCFASILSPHTRQMVVKVETAILLNSLDQRAQ
jgi:hypothetical protein